MAEVVKVLRFLAQKQQFRLDEDHLFFNEKHALSISRPESDQLIFKVGRFTPEKTESLLVGKLAYYTQTLYECTRHTHNMICGEYTSAGELNGLRVDVFRNCSYPGFYDELAIPPREDGVRHLGTVEKHGVALIPPYNSRGEEWVRVKAQRVGDYVEVEMYCGPTNQAEQRSYVFPMEVETPSAILDQILGEF